MKIKLKSLTFTRWVIYLDALIWLLFATITALGLHPALPETPWYRWIYAIVAFLTGFCLIILFFFSLKGSKFSYYLLLMGVFLIAIQSITDQVGIIDLSVLVINLVLFILLLKDRKTYLSNRNE
jgi:hypothetical protein